MALAAFLLSFTSLSRASLDASVASFNTAHSSGFVSVASTESAFPSVRKAASSASPVAAAASAQAKTMGTGNTRHRRVNGDMRSSLGGFEAPGSIRNFANQDGSRIFFRGARIRHREHSFCVNSQALVVYSRVRIVVEIRKSFA